MSDSREISPPAIDPQALAAAINAALSGAINVSVVAGGQTYTLSVSIPTASGDPYTFFLTQGSNTLAWFAFKGDDQFTIQVNMPSVAGITAGFKLQEGEPIPPPAPPAPPPPPPAAG